MAFYLVAALAGALALAGQEPEPIVEVCTGFPVLFAEGSARLDRSAIRVLDDWAAMARRLDAPYDRYTIQAYADPEGTAAGNLLLSFRRGRAIMRYLAGRGFRPKRFRVRAMGESEQLWVAPGTSPRDARAQNRIAYMIMETRPSNWRRVYGNLIC